MNKIKILLEMLQKLQQIIPTRYLKQLPLIMIGSLVASGLEVLGVAILLPFMSVLTDRETLKTKWYIKYFVDKNIINDYDTIVIIIGILVCMVYVVKNIILLLMRNVQNKYQCHVQCALSVEMLEYSMKRPYEYHLNNNSSEIITSITKDTDNIYAVIGNFMNIISEGLTALSIVIFVFLLDPKMAFGILLVAMFCVFVIVMGLKRIATRTGIKSRQTYNLMFKSALQAIGGIKEITVMCKRYFFVEDYRKQRERHRDASITNIFMNLLPERIVEVLFVSGLVVALLIRIETDKNIISSLVVLTAFAGAAYRLMPSINKLSSNFTSLIFYQPSLEAAYNNIMASREFEDEIIKHNIRGCNEIKINNTFITVNNVYYRYSKNEENVLTGINLHINNGEAIGIIGESGAGKSTLVDVMLGLFIPQSGSVYVNGIDIYSNPEMWSKMLGYVPQSVYLLDSTLRENVAFGVKKNDISDVRVWQCLEEAQIAEFIRNLPTGLDTILGERGVRLSGGQRQRIAIARALYNNPEILFLDEATSALDIDTEQAVMESINTFMGKKTLIIVAHRLSTVMKCDRIYEIVDGKAMERRKEQIIK